MFNFLRTYSNTDSTRTFKIFYTEIPLQMGQQVIQGSCESDKTCKTIKILRPSVGQSCPNMDISVSSLPGEFMT